MAPELSSAVALAQKGIFWTAVACIAVIAAKFAIERLVKTKVSERKRKLRLVEKTEEMAIEREARIQTAQAIKRIRSEPVAKFHPPGAAPDGYEWRLVKKRDSSET